MNNPNWQDNCPTCGTPTGAGHGERCLKYGDAGYTPEDLRAADPAQEEFDRAALEEVKDEVLLTAPQSPTQVPDGWQQLLKDAAYAINFQPSCQAHAAHVDFCACTRCVLDRIEAMLAAAAPQPPAQEPTEAEKVRGFVSFGSGAYRMQQCKDASLVVCFRKPEEMNLPVGSRARELDSTPIPPEEIIAWLRFESASGLDALEVHLKEIREDHWPETVQAPQPASEPNSQLDALIIREIEVCEDVMEQLGSLDPDDIDGDTFEYGGETPDGRDCRPDLSITEWAARTAKTLRTVLKSQPASERVDEREVLKNLDYLIHQLSFSRMGCPESVAKSICEQARAALLTAPVEPKPLRYTGDGALAECPCCGSLDVGGAHETVNCYSCGLTVTKPRPLQNAIDAWNRRAALRTAPVDPVDERKKLSADLKASIGSLTQLSDSLEELRAALRKGSA